MPEIYSSKGVETKKYRQIRRLAMSLWRSAFFGKIAWNASNKTRRFDLDTRFEDSDTDL